MIMTTTIPDRLLRTIRHRRRYLVTQPLRRSLPTLRAQSQQLPVTVALPVLPVRAVLRPAIRHSVDATSKG